MSAEIEKFHNFFLPLIIVLSIFNFWLNYIITKQALIFNKCCGLVTFQFVLSTLYVWIQFFLLSYVPCCLCLKKSLKWYWITWEINTEREIVQFKFWRKRGVLVDKVKPAGSATLSTPFKVLHYHKVTGMSESLLYYFCIIFQMLS
jgi:hypothetical protein